MTATLAEPDVVEVAGDAVPCASKACEVPATVVVPWTDANGHGRDVPLCDPHAGILLRTDAETGPLVCFVCLAPVVIGLVRPITP